MKTWSVNSVDSQIFQIALDEDLGQPWLDATTDLLFAEQRGEGKAIIISKQTSPITICGLAFLPNLLAKMTAHFRIETVYEDGDLLQFGEVLATLHAEAKVLLKIERVLLNFMRHCSAIATLTHHYVSKVKHTRMKILDTRKTTPGLRHLEKYAVFCGGGVNHRMGLYDAIMIKDTHVDLLGGMKATLAKLPTSDQQPLPVIVEVRSLQELEVVLMHGNNKVQRVLLDNMNCQQMQQAVTVCEDVFETEASGNIRLNTIAEIAETGVNFASIGELTYNAGQVDLSMRTEPLETIS